MGECSGMKVLARERSIDTTMGTRLQSFSLYSTWPGILVCFYFLLRVGQDCSHSFSILCPENCSLRCLSKVFIESFIIPTISCFQVVAHTCVMGVHSRFPHQAAQEPPALPFQTVKRQFNGNMQNSRSFLSKVSIWIHLEGKGVVESSASYPGGTALGTPQTSAAPCWIRLNIHPLKYCILAWVAPAKDMMLNIAVLSSLLSVPLRSCAAAFLTSFRNLFQNALIK